MTVKVWPAIVIVAVRGPVPVFADALNAAVSLPLAPDVTVNHDALLLAVHAHPAGAVTATEPDSPGAAIAWLVADSV